MDIACDTGETSQVLQVMWWDPVLVKPLNDSSIVNLKYAEISIYSKSAHVLCR